MPVEPLPWAALELTWKFWPNCCVYSRRPPPAAPVSATTPVCDVKLLIACATAVFVKPAARATVAVPSGPTMVRVSLAPRLVELLTNAVLDAVVPTITDRPPFWAFCSPRLLAEATVSWQAEAVLPVLIAVEPMPVVPLSALRFEMTLKLAPTLNDCSLRLPPPLVVACTPVSELTLLIFDSTVASESPRDSATLVVPLGPVIVRTSSWARLVIVPAAER